MTIAEAKRIAKQRGWYGLPGGWIYDQHGKPICHGWANLRSKLAVSRSDCRICGGGGFLDVEGGDCPGCKGSGVE